MHAGERGGRTSSSLVGPISFQASANSGSMVMMIRERVPQKARRGLWIRVQVQDAILLPG